jgi:peptidoglycan/LPS O-acetylase OafA/YrhL
MMTGTTAGRRPTLPALTGLRAVAALLVVLFHYKYLVPGLAQSADAGARIVQAGYVGVSLFFVLSGFILAYTYLDPDGGMRGSLSDFWFARFARIYPVYFVALLIALPIFIDIAFVHPVGVMKLKDTLRTAFVTPLLLQGWTPKRAWMWNGPGWSLSAEAFFYLLFPVFGVAIAKKSVKWIIAIALIVFGFILLPQLLYGMTRPEGLTRINASTYGPWVAFLKFSPLVHLPQFVLGIATGVLFLRRRGKDTRSARMAWLATLSVAAAIVVLASSHRIPYLLLQGGLLAPLFAIVIYSLACGRGFIATILSNTLSMRLGEASYALYLIHMPLSWYLAIGRKAAGIPAPNAWVGLSIYVVIAVAVSFALYYIVERPSRERLQAWYRARGTGLPYSAEIKRFAEVSIRVLTSDPRAAMSIIRADG